MTRNGWQVISGIGGRFDPESTFSYEALVNHILKIEKREHINVDDLKRLVRKLKDYDLSPTVVYEDGFAIFKIARFSKWGGLMEGRYHVTLEPPHTIERCDTTILLEYDCGIMF